MRGAGDEAPSAPQPIGKHHEFEDFDSGQPTLDEWLRRRARANDVAGASRTFVTAVGVRVVGFYALSATAISRELAPAGLARNMPSPVPMLLLGRLAVDHRWQGRGIGDGLMRDAITKALNVSENAGVRGMLVHALSDDAAQFYRRWGFAPSAADPLLMMVRLDDIVRALKSP